MLKLFLVAVLVNRAPDPDAALVKLLGSPWFGVRDRAELILGKRCSHGQMTPPAAVAAGLASPDPEVYARVGRAWQAGRPNRLKAAAVIVDREFDDFPCIDSLWWNRTTLSYDKTMPEFEEYEWYLKRLWNMPYPRPPIKHHRERPLDQFRLAYRLSAVDRVADGVLVKTLLAEARRLYLCDYEWFRFPYGIPNMNPMAKFDGPAWVPGRWLLEYTAARLPLVIPIPAESFREKIGFFSF